METVAITSKPGPFSHAPPHLPPPEIQTPLSLFQISEFIYAGLRLVGQLKNKTKTKTYGSEKIGADICCLQKLISLGGG